MERKRGSVRLSLAVIGAASVLYYWGWFAEKRTEAPRELPPFTLSSPYWEDVADESAGKAPAYDTFFRSYCVRWQRYAGKRGERIILSLSLLSDVAPVIHCYMWNRDTMVDKGGLRVLTGLDNPERIEARKFLFRSGRGEDLCLYWYMGLEETSSSFFSQQIQGLKRRLLDPRSCFLMIRVVSPVGEGGEGEASEIAERFIRDAFPSLQRYYKKVTLLKSVSRNHEEHEGHEEGCRGKGKKA